MSKMKPNMKMFMALNTLTRKTLTPSTQVCTQKKLNGRTVAVSRSRIGRQPWAELMHGQVGKVIKLINFIQNANDDAGEEGKFVCTNRTLLYSQFHK